MACGSFSGFRRGISHFFTSTKIQPRVWEKKNERTNTDLGQFQAQEREFCHDFVQLFVHLKTNAGLYFARNFFKATWNANSFLTVFPHCLLLLTVRPLDSVVDCSLSLSGFLSQLTLCLLSDLPFLLHFRTRRRSRVQAVCLGFAPKQTKRSSAWRTTHIVSQTSKTGVSLSDAA